MEFKDRLKLLRTMKELSFSQLATEFKKTEAAIRSWELGRNKPDADTLIKLSEYFDVSVDYLLGLSDYFGKDDFQSAVNRANELTKNIENLQRGEAEMFVEILNWCLETLANSSTVNKDKYNNIFNCLIYIINSYAIMIKVADELNDTINEHKLIEKECKIYADFDISPFISFIGAKNSFDIPINKLYIGLSHMILNSIKDIKQREIIEKYLLPSDFNF